MKRTVVQTREKVTKTQDISDGFGNIDFSKFASPQLALDKMAETTRYLEGHSIKKTQTLTADNILETTLIETEIPTQSHSSQFESRFFQPSTSNLSSTTLKAPQSSSSSNNSVNNGIGIVSEIHLEGSCRPAIQSSIGKVTLPPGMILSPEMEKLVESHQNETAKHVIRKVVISNPLDTELVEDVKRLISEKLSDERYNTDDDIIELSNEIQQILTSYESVQHLSSKDRAALIYKRDALKEICDYIGNSQISPM